LLLLWVVTGVMTLMGALSYAELAGMMPHAGGQYVYLREAYSPLWGFLYGWTLFLVHSDRLHRRRGGRLCQVPWRAHAAQRHGRATGCGRRRRCADGDQLSGRA